MKTRNTEPENRPSIRTELELDVTACNGVLKPFVRRMSYVRLLHNCHPIYREQFARRLRDSGLLSNFTATQFLKKSTYAD